MASAASLHKEIKNLMAIKKSSKTWAFSNCLASQLVCLSARKTNKEKEETMLLLYYCAMLKLPYRI